MVNAFSLQLSPKELDALCVTRSLSLSTAETETSLPSWVGIEFLIICSQHIPFWVAKISETLLPKRADEPMLIRFSEARSVWELNGDSEYTRIMRDFSHKAYGHRCVPQSFVDERFFTAGEVVPLMAFEPPHRLSLERAVDLLATSYGVAANQVKITITSALHADD